MGLCDQLLASHPYYTRDKKKTSHPKKKDTRLTIDLSLPFAHRLAVCLLGMLDPVVSPIKT